MNIVFHGTNAANFHDGIETRLTTSHHVTRLPDDLSDRDARDIFVGADVIIGTSLSGTDPVPRLARLYQVAGAGYDGITREVLPSGCWLCNCFGHETAIGEYVTAAILTRYVPLVQADSELRDGNWHFRAGNPGGLRTECSGRTVGLLGYGHIGKEIAAKAKALGMNVHVANRSPLSPDDFIDRSFPLSSLHSFYTDIDILVAALPLADATVGLVDTAAFKLMKPDCLVINVGRGEVIDERALYNALKNQTIGNAVIDTWYVYPNEEERSPLPGNLPFHELDNITITPHMSGWTHGTILRRQQVIAENIDRLALGKPLLNVVYQQPGKPETEIV